MALPLGGARWVGLAPFQVCSLHHLHHVLLLSVPEWGKAGDPQHLFLSIP